MLYLSSLIPDSGQNPAMPARGERIRVARHARCTTRENVKCVALRDLLARAAADRRHAIGLGELAETQAFAVQLFFDESHHVSADPKAGELALQRDRADTEPDPTR